MPICRMRPETPADVRHLGDAHARGTGFDRRHTHICVPRRADSLCIVHMLEVTSHPRSPEQNMGSSHPYTAWQYQAVAALSRAP